MCIHFNGARSHCCSLENELLQDGPIGKRRELATKIRIKDRDCGLEVDAIRTNALLEIAELDMTHWNRGVDKKTKESRRVDPI